MSDSQSKYNGKNTKLSMSHAAGKGKTKRRTYPIAEGRWISSGSQNVEATCKIHGNDTVDSEDIILIPGNDDEDTDSETSYLEIIDEAEFRNTKTDFLPKIGTSTRQKVNERSTAATSRENVIDWNKKISSAGKKDDYRKRKAGSAYSRRTKIDEEMENGNAFLHDDEIGSFGPGLEINLGISSRTRSKTGIINKRPKVDKIQLDLSDESSSSTDSGNDSLDIDDLEVENSYLSDSTESCSYVGYDVQNDMIKKMTAKKSEGCSKKEGSALKHVSNKRVISNHYNEDKEKCNHPAVGRRDVPFKKRHLISDASSNGCEEGNLYGRNKVTDENAVINTIPGDDADADENFKHRSNVQVENLPTSPCSKQPCTQKDCDGEEGVNVLRYKSQLLACIKRRKKAVSLTHSKDGDCGHSDDHIHEKTDATSSDIHDHDKTDKVTEADETENHNNRNRGSSKHYDLYRKLADSVLERGPMLEKDESNVVSKLTAVNQNQTSLPLKFRFEDEVPKQVEKTDFEKEIEALFDESLVQLALDELDSFNHTEVDQERESSPVGETQDARCARGKHELVMREAEGLICIYCLHVELSAKDILPEWAERTFRESKKRSGSSRDEELPQFDEFHLASTTNECAAFNSNSGTVWNIKPGIRESMYKHQQEGFEFLWMNLAGSINLVDLKSSDPTEVGGCIISHAPGTGKTRLTIVFIETYLKLFPNCRPVIIAPAGMLLTWEEEFKKWNVGFPFHNLNTLELLGKDNRASHGFLSGRKRQNKDITRMMKIYAWNLGGSVLGISYSLFEKLTGEKYIKEIKNKKKRTNIDEKTEALRQILLEKPGLVVLDEGHTPRNQRSNIWNALLKLQTGKRVILSGTPFQNNFAELFNTLRLVRPAIADALAQEKTFSGMISSRGLPSRRTSDAKDSHAASSSEAMNSAVEKLKSAMSPFVHVHKGTILRESLPGLRDCVVLLKPPALQESLIKTLEGFQSTFKFEHKVALISVHPYLYKYCDSTENHGLGIELDAVEASKLNPNEGVKTKFILELVRLSVALNEKVLVFSQYIQPLELIKEQLKAVFEWIEGKQILRMEGKLEQKQRQIIINTFNDPHSEAKIMLASTRCCSEGISLVGASRVVLLDVVWNPSVECQAISRAYRIGQTKFVYTYHLMTSGTTEADKYCRQVEKERLSELVFCSSSNENKERRIDVIEDRILEEMVSHAKLKDMFEKIINQPKDTDLIQTFGLT